MPNPEESEEGPLSDADKAVLSLVIALQGGQKLSPQYLAVLEQVVQGQRPLGVEAIVELPRLETAQHVDAVQSPFLSGAWKEYWDLVTLEEFAALSSSDIVTVNGMAQALASETVSFKAAATKPLGLIKMYGEDWCTVDVKGPNHDMSKTINSLKSSLGPELIRIGEVNFEENTMHLFDFPGNSNLAVLRCCFNTPQGTSKCDNRPLSHDYWLVIEKGSIYKNIKQGIGLKVFPFILRNAAAIVDPQKSVFFDGSLSGNDGLFGKGANPISLVDYSGRSLIRIADTRLDASPSVESAASAADLFQLANTRIAKARWHERKFNSYENRLPNRSDKTYSRAQKPSA